MRRHEVRHVARLYPDETHADTGIERMYAEFRLCDGHQRRCRFDNCRQARQPHHYQADTIIDMDSLLLPDSVHRQSHIKGQDSVTATRV